MFHGKGEVRPLHLSKCCTHKEVTIHLRPSQANSGHEEATRRPRGAAVQLNPPFQNGHVTCSLNTVLQEEVMSPHLRAFLESHRELLAADLCLSADGGQVSEQQGGISLGLR